MSFKVIFLFCFFTALSSSTTAFTLDSRPQARSTYPFNQIVAFGDEFSDNGSGSFAHGITGSPDTVYGFGTWTNGPVAVSYLSSLLSVPLRDFAFGGCCGGSSFGATLDNTYSASPAKSPSLIDQITNYTGHSHSNVKNTLEFIWVGQNDLSLHTDAFYLSDSANGHFYSNFSSRTVSSVQNLLNAGAPYVFVANIYPKHLAPVTSRYLCGMNTECVTDWGQVVQAANSALQASLKHFGNKIIYYDVYEFMTGLLDNAAANGFTKPLTDYCDGGGDAMWMDCMVDGHAGEYFWMNFEQPTSRVHQLIAKDMKSTIDQHFGL